MSCMHNGLALGSYGKHIPYINMWSSHMTGGCIMHYYSSMWLSHWLLGVCLVWTSSSAGKKLHTIENVVEMSLVASVREHWHFTRITYSRLRWTECKRLTLVKFLFDACISCDVSVWQFLGQRLRSLGHHDKHACSEQLSVLRFSSQTFSLCFY